MWGGHNAQQRRQGEYLSDLWIQQNVPGGLNSKSISISPSVKFIVDNKREKQSSDDLKT